MTTGESGAALEDVYRLTPLQEGLLFHTVLEGGSDVYVMQVVLSLEGELEEAALEAAWRLVMARHPALRTAVVWEDGGHPLQVVWREAELPLARLDWRGLSDSEAEAELAALLAGERARGFELDRPPLFRLALVRRGPRRAWLACSLHHLLLDGWSLANVLSEVTAAYRRLAAGEEPELPPVRPFRDYI